jgi:hypothetical protein
MSKVNDPAILMGLPVAGVSVKPPTVRLYDRMLVPGGGVSGLACKVTLRVASPVTGGGTTPPLSPRPLQAVVDREISKAHKSTDFV